MNTDATAFSLLLTSPVTAGSISLWVLLLGLLTLAGFLQQVGTFGRSAAPYTLLITLSLMVVLGTGWLAILCDRLILSGRT